MCCNFAMFGRECNQSNLAGLLQVRHPALVVDADP